MRVACSAELKWRAKAEDHAYKGWYVKESRTSYTAVFKGAIEEISHPQCFASPYQLRQQTLFDPLWAPEPIENQSNQPQKPQKRNLAGNQLRLYLGPESVKASG
jgi:hypothetical protein